MKFRRHNYVNVVTYGAHQQVFDLLSNQRLSTGSVRRVRGRNGADVGDDDRYAHASRLHRREADSDFYKFPVTNRA